MTDDKREVSVIKDSNAIWKGHREYILAFEPINGSDELTAFAASVIDSHQCKSFIESLTVNFKRPNLVLEAIQPHIRRTLIEMYRRGQAVDDCAEDIFSTFYLMLEPNWGDSEDED